MPMKNHRKQKMSRYSLFRIMLICTTFLCIVTVAVPWAGETEKAGTVPLVVGEVPDPFQPFIKIISPKEEKKKAAERERQEKKPRVPVPPLQRYAVEEFILVGIARSGNDSIAIVEDSRGKSYPLHKGTHIGMNDGVVKSIRPGSVIVVEKETDENGDTRTRDVVLSFAREENEEGP